MNYIFNDIGIILDDGTQISYDEILLERAKIKYKDSILVKFTAYYGRDSFIYKKIMLKSEWEELKNRFEEDDDEELPRSFYLGELAGKHSEVYYEWGNDEEESDIYKIFKFSLSHGESSGDVDILDVIYTEIE